MQRDASRKRIQLAEMLFCSLSFQSLGDRTLVLSWANPTPSRQAQCSVALISGFFGSVNVTPARTFHIFSPKQVAFTRDANNQNQCQKIQKPEQMIFDEFS